MALDIPRILHLSAAAARIYDPPLHFMGVTSALSEGGHVELLFKFSGCHGLQECLVMVSVARDSEATLAAELPNALRSAVTRHRQGADPNGTSAP